MKKIIFFLLMFSVEYSCLAQEVSLSFFLESAKSTNDSLFNTTSLQKMGKLQQQLIIAQNRLPQVEATAAILVAPYFNTDGKVVDITTSPSQNAYGYDAGITNGGLYAGQIKITQQIFNRTITDNLLFQEQIKNESLNLTYAEVYHNLKNTITALYINTYGYQMQEQFNNALLADLETRLKVIGILVKNGIVAQSDYIVLQVTIDQTKITIGQLQNTLNALKRQLFELGNATLDVDQKLGAPQIDIDAQNTDFFYQKRYASDSLLIDADLQVFNNKYKPKIFVYGDAGLNAVDLSNSYRKLGTSVGLQFNLSIFDGHQKQINAEKGFLRMENLQHTLQNNKIIKSNNLVGLLNQTALQNQNLVLMDHQLENQRLLKKIYQDKLVHGQVSVIDYLNIIQNYKSAESTKIQMQTNLLLLQNQYEYINW